MQAPSCHVGRGQFQDNVREYAFATQQGNLLEVKVKLSHSESPAPELRGQVKGFSPPARLRLLKAIARIDWAGLGRSSFLTLTYPDKFLGITYKVRTQHRTAVMRAFEGYVGGPVHCLWRIEFKPRLSGKNKGRIGAHQHLLLLNVPYIPKPFIMKTWRRAIGHKGYVHVHIEEAASGEKAAMYAAKYAAKPPQEGPLVNASYLNMGGRAYGFHRKSGIPMARKRELSTLDEGQLAVAMNVAAEELGNYRVGSFCLLGEKAEKAFWRIVGKGKREIDE